MQDMTKNVLEYITDLKNKSGYDNPQYVFTNGKCGKFAKLLQDKFGGDILFINEYKHFVLCLNQKLYDATGNVTKCYTGLRFKRLEDMNDKQLAGYEF